MGSSVAAEAVKRGPVHGFGARPAFTDLAARDFDVVVIGGGINGAGIARAAALAGLRVVLLERDDFGFGTTWRSTKLIHGGLRYLEHREFGLVFESLRDQALLLREYPEMVRPLSLLLPVYRGDAHGAAAIGLGLTLYDLLARGRGLPPHHRYAPAAAVQLEPALRRERLRAAFTYSDSQVAYPERLCLQTLFEAAAAGATVLNHAEVTGLLQPAGGRIAGVVVHDRLGATAIELRARAVVNAAGPWVDEVLAGVSVASGPQIGGTKGTHIVVDCGLAGPLHALYAETRHDHRPFFIVPWRDRHLIGTTDTRFSGQPEAVKATGAEIDYLLAEANHLLPGAPLRARAVQYAYAGVRPLPATSGVSAGAITRRHLIRDHAESGHPGLFSIIGGKLSTYRSLAAESLHKLSQSLRFVPHLPEIESECPAPPTAAEALSGLRPGLLDHLRGVYGPRLEALARLLASCPELARPLCPHGPDIEAQVVLAARAEAAHTLADTLLRRVGAGWNACLGLDCGPRAAELMARELGWAAERVRRELTDYALAVERTFTLPGRPAPITVPTADRSWAADG